MPRRPKNRAPRVQWNTPGRIRFHNVPVTLPCIVHNLSNTGAGITAPNVAILPENFTLELSRRGVSHDCFVVWRTKSEVGVAFMGGAPSVVQPRAVRARAAISAY